MPYVSAEEGAEDILQEQTIVPGKPENTKPAKDEVTKAGTKTTAKKSAGKAGKAVAGRVASPKTGDDVHSDLWLELIALAAGGAMITVLRKNRKEATRKG